LSRVVIDANVFLAGFVGESESPPAVLLNALERGQVEVLACPQLLNELEAGLAKPYFRTRLDHAQARRAVEAIRSATIALADPVDPPRVVRDPGDDYLVALAKMGGAELIVSGDRDLLDDPQLDPPAVNPRAACLTLGLA
jgi:putative PIN family toxin of toxin-antitoxin system